MEASGLDLLISFKDLLATGVTAAYSSEIQVYLCKNLVPLLLNFGMVDRTFHKRGTNYETERFILSALGNKYLSLYEIDKAKN